MRLLLKSIAVSTIAIAQIQLSSHASAGVLKSLDDELTSLVGKTDPYMVTVKGEGQLRNLIATGIIYNKNGYVITSAQVYDTESHQVMFKNGESLPAEKIGVDNQTGLAVLKIDKGDLKTPSWGKSVDLKQGAWIMVVGNSYGTPSTVNFGVFEGKTDEGYLKLGVGVSPGGSGGAVLNTNGDVVGILIAREAESQAAVESYLKNLYRASSAYEYYDRKDSEERAIAIPSDLAADVVDQIIKDGKVRRGFLGISQKNLTPDELKDLQIDRGVMVVDVVEGSPAEKAGLEKGNVIVEVDGKPISGTSELYGVIRSRKPGDEITITYVSDGKSLKTQAKLEEARDDMLFGGWKLKELYPKLNVGKVFDMTGKSDLEQKVLHLDKEVARLQKELDELRGDLEKK